MSKELEQAQRRFLTRRLPVDAHAAACRKLKARRVPEGEWPSVEDFTLAAQDRERAAKQAAASARRLAARTPPPPTATVAEED